MWLSGGKKKKAGVMALVSKINLIFNTLAKTIFNFKISYFCFPMTTDQNIIKRNEAANSPND